MIQSNYLSFRYSLGSSKRWKNHHLQEQISTWKMWGHLHHMLHGLCNKRLINSLKLWRRAYFPSTLLRVLAIDQQILSDLQISPLKIIKTIKSFSLRLWYLFLFPAYSMASSSVIVLFLQLDCCTCPLVIIFSPKKIFFQFESFVFLFCFCVPTCSLIYF